MLQTATLEWFGTSRTVSNVMLLWSLGLLAVEICPFHAKVVCTVFGSTAYCMVNLKLF